MHRPQNPGRPGLFTFDERSKGVSSLLLSILFMGVMGAANLGCVTHSARLEAAVASEGRSAEQKARDRYRRPLEALTFFGIEEDMTVIEIYPGAGWYSQILAPYLKDKGRLIAAVYDRDPKTQEEWMVEYNARYKKNFLDNKEAYGEIEVVDLVLPDRAVLAPPGSVDMILDFRNAHNWIIWGPDAMVKGFFSALKSGGILGVIDHRMDEDKPYDPDNGYIHEGQLIELIENHGFKLVVSSEMNRNPLDTKNHPEGVWTLPPTLALGPETSAKYIEIGESDRMTLKFVKP